MINLRDFFDAYDRAFRETAKSIAQFYFEPCITARTGVPRLNATRTDTESFFGQVLEKYRAQGFDHGQILSFNLNLSAQTAYLRRSEGRSRTRATRPYGRDLQLQPL